jgi:hypothetical protein
MMLDRATGPVVAERDRLEGAPLLWLNRQCDRIEVPAGVSESIIEEILSDLLAVDPAQSQAQYWLLMGRLAEMTLLCAGHYADNAELGLAYRLLFSCDENGGRAAFPFLCDQLKNSGRISNLYLVGLRARLEEVFETMKFFNECRIRDSETLWKRCHEGSRVERDAIHIQQCHLDPQLYREMGEEFQRIQLNPDHRCTFLKYPTAE